MTETGLTVFAPGEQAAGHADNGLVRHELIELLQRLADFMRPVEPVGIGQNPGFLQLLNLQYANFVLASYLIFHAD
jgi:hypothetical protein